MWCSWPIWDHWALVVVSARCVELSGPTGRVLNASVVGVAFRLPLFGVDACKRAACRARGGAADVWSVKATPEAVAIRFGQTELLQALLDLGEELLRLCWVFWRFGEVLDALSTRGHREEWGKRRAMLGLR
ncbi:hypothetical protein Taro_017665, partial [Colocasia esculenta]|nr:hypothetical protein [Colocasia esculenta]